jgi:hypothetical protein
MPSLANKARNERLAANPPSPSEESVDSVARKRSQPQVVTNKILGYDATIAHLQAKIMEVEVKRNKLQAVSAERAQYGREQGEAPAYESVTLYTPKIVTQTPTNTEQVDTAAVAPKAEPPPVRKLSDRERKLRDRMQALFLHNSLY